ncbi:MAG: MFS transporter [Planctomycetota bacterium]|nr:MAG: MFS transporter [Planctomycetota bacterium]
MLESAQKPFAPASWPFFYGWVIAVIGPLAVICSMPGQTNGVGPFIDELLGATGLSRTQLSTSYLIGTSLCGIALPWVGNWIDRWGCRVMLVVSSLGLAGILVIMSGIDHIGHGLGQASGHPIPATFITLTLALAFLRLFGQGMMTVTAKTLIGRWFERYRGRVAACAGVVQASAFSFAPALFYLLIDTTTWRMAWMILALACGVGMAVLAWLFARDNPEDCGLHPDGRVSAKPEHSSSSGIAVHAWHHATRPEALRRSGFWAVTLILSTHACLFTAFTFHIIGLGGEAGLSPQHATAALIPMAVISPCVGFIVGFLCDSVRIKWLLLAMVVLQLLTYASASAMEVPLLRWLAIFGFAAGVGFFGPLSSVAMPRFFGRTHLGAINGAMMSSVVIASAIGPLILSLALDATGRLGQGFFWALILPTLGLLLAMKARNPQEIWRQQDPNHSTAP